MNYWIDERGRFWPGESFRPRHDGFILTAYGLIKLESRGSALVLSFAPGNISKRALQAAREFVQEAFINQVVTFRYYLGGWATEHCYGPERALARLEQLTDGSLKLPSNPYQVERRVASWDSEAMPLIVGLTEHWERRGGAVSVEDPMLLSTMPRLVRFQQRQGAYEYSWIGDASMCRVYYGETASRVMIGRAFERTPGSRKFKTVGGGKFYNRVLDTWQPRYDRVQTLYDKNPREPIWFHYQRLILPIEQPDGEQAVLILCEETPHLSMPFAA